MGQHKTKKREKSRPEMVETSFLAVEKFNKEGQDGNEENQENSFDIKTGSGEERDEKKNKKIEETRILEVGDEKKEKPREGAVKPSEGLERDEESLEGVEI